MLREAGQLSFFLICAVYLGKENIKHVQYYDHRLSETNLNFAAPKCTRTCGKMAELTASRGTVFSPLTMCTAGIRFLVSQAKILETPEAVLPFKGVKPRPRFSINLLYF